MKMADFVFVQMREVFHFDVLGGLEDGLAVFKLTLDLVETEPRAQETYFLNFAEAKKFAIRLLQWLPETDSDGLSWEMYFDPTFTKEEKGTRETKLFNGWTAKVRFVGGAELAEDDFIIAFILDVQDTPPREVCYAMSQASADFTLRGLLRSFCEHGYRLQITDDFAEARSDE